VSQQKGAKKVSMSNIADYFFRQCGIPTNEWNFCDSLFVRYFTKVPPNLYVGKEFACHAAWYVGVPFLFFRFFILYAASLCAFASRILGC
jgi:hypothetical protein